MGLELEMEIEGLDELLNDLKQLPQKLRRNALRSGIDWGAREVRDAAKRTTAFSDHRGNLRDSIVMKRERLGARWEAVARVLAEAPHAHLVEYGHRQVNVKGEQTGDVDAHPFLVPAIEENRERIKKTIKERIRKYLDKKLSKLKG